MAYEVSVDDLEDLYRAGRVKLPKGAVQFGLAAQKLDATAKSESAGFGGELGISPVLSAFQGLRNLMQNRVLVETQHNLIESGKALCDIAEDFASLDSENAKGLKNVVVELNTGKNAEGDPIPPDDRPPERIPEAPRSDGKEAGTEKLPPPRTEIPDDPGGPPVADSRD